MAARFSSAPPSSPRRVSSPLSTARRVGQRSACSRKSGAKASGRRAATAPSTRASESPKSSFDIEFPWFPLFPEPENQGTKEPRNQGTDREQGTRNREPQSKNIWLIKKDKAARATAATRTR